MENINVGTLPNDGNGDTLRAAFIKVNENFDEVSQVNTEFDERISENTAEISGKAPVVHTHTISQVVNLQSTLDLKASTSYVNAEIAALQQTIAALILQIQSLDARVTALENQ